MLTNFILKNISDSIPRGPEPDSGGHRAPAVPRDPLSERSLHDAPDALQRHGDRPLPEGHFAEPESPAGPGQLNEPADPRSPLQPGKHLRHHQGQSVPHHGQHLFREGIQREYNRRKPIL